MDEQKSKEKTEAYRHMSQLWAFTDMLNAIKGLKEDALRDLVAVPISEATASKFGEIKGIVSTVDKIVSEVESILGE